MLSSANLSREPSKLDTVVPLHIPRRAFECYNSTIYREAEAYIERHHQNRIDLAVSTAANTSATV